MMIRLALLAALLPAGALAQGDAGRYNPTKPLPGELGNPVIGGPLGNNDPADHTTTPDAMAAAEPSSPVEQEWLRGRLVGKPVYGAGGRIGEISDLVIGADQRVTNAVVRVDARLDPDRANLPVPWNWVAGQLDAPTVIVPWNPAQIAWLTEPGRSRRNPVTPTALSEPMREAWRQQAAAELDRWRDRIDGEALRQGEGTSNVRQLRLAWGAARDRWERLGEAGDDAWAVEQSKLQAELDDLRETWTKLAEAPP